ncbi:MAG: GreA/GreB family elongation factor [Planctomycetes bacterium]|nr:GreA/GreB family elongation factor [Planctomycetota bacterium]
MTLSTETARISELIDRSQFGEIETAWAQAVKKAPGDVDTFLSLAQRMSGAGQAEKAAVLLETLVQPLVDSGDAGKAVRVIESIARVNPQHPKLKETAQKVYPVRYSAVPGLEKLIARAEEESKGGEAAFVESLSRQVALLPGDYCFHDAGWGLGKVLSMDAATGSMVIDFEHKKNHTVKIGSAARFFKKLPADDIMVQRAADLGGLKARSESDPASVIITVLKSQGAKSNLKRIKAELVPAVIDAKGWSKWWQGARKALNKHSFVKVGAGNNPNLELLARAVTQDNEAMETFENAHKLVDKAAALRRYLRESDPSAERAAALPKTIAPLVKLAEKDSDKVLVGFLIADINKAEAGVNAQLPYDLDVLLKDGAKLVAALPKVPDADYQVRALERHRELNEGGWADTYGKAFLADVSGAWDNIADRLQKAEPAQLASTLKKVIADAEDFPLQYLWLGRRAILGQTLPPGLELPPSDKIYERLTWLTNKVLTRIERGENRLKDMLVTLRSALAERQGRLLSEALKDVGEDRAGHLLHAVKRCRALSDTHSAMLNDVVTKAYPALMQREDKFAALARGKTSDEILATQQGRRKREEELRRVQEEELPAVAKQIGEALAMGDISENAELDAAREREGRLKERAREIIDELKRVRVVEPDDVDPSTAGFGTKVSLKRTDGKTVEYTIFGPYEADHERNIISNESPIAQGILGKKPGDKAVVTTPEGTVNYEVGGISKASF